ncbi:MAG: hypothetical protein V1698_00245, partial [bacterium]
KKSGESRNFINGASITFVLLFSFSALAMAVSYELGSIKLVLPFLLGISLASILTNLSGRIFAKSIKKEGAEVARNIGSAVSNIYSGSAEIFSNLMISASSASVLGLFLTGVNGRAVLLPVSLVLLAAFYVLAQSIAVQFSEKIRRWVLRNSLINFFIFILAGAFFAVRSLLGITSVFFCFALGVVSAVILEKIDAKSIYKQAVFLGTIILTFSVAFKINGKINGFYAAAITGLGMVLMLVIVYFRNFNGQMLAFSSDFSEKNQQETGYLKGERVENSKLAISLAAFFALFLLFAKLFAITSISIASSRTIFGLFAGAFLAVLGKAYFTQSINSISFASKNFAEDIYFENNYKRYIKLVSGLSVKASLILLSLLVALPMAGLFALGFPAFVAILAGEVIASFPLSGIIEEDWKCQEIIEIIKLLLLIGIVFLPILIQIR